MLSGLLIALILLAIVVACGAKMADPRVMGPIDTTLPLQAAAVTKTASFNGAGLDMGSGFAPPAGMPVQSTIPISAADFASADETYDFEVEDSPDNATFTKRGAKGRVVAGDVGRSVTIDGVIFQRYVRYALTVAGTTPSITYGPAYLVPRRG